MLLAQHMYEIGSLPENCKTIVIHPFTAHMVSLPSCFSLRSSYSSKYVARVTTSVAWYGNKKMNYGT